MNEDKRKALESAGWKFGSADEFLGERPMSDSDKMRAEFEIAAKQYNYLTVRLVEYDYTDSQTRAIWNFYQLGYAAGGKAEREAIQCECKSAVEDIVGEAAFSGLPESKQKRLLRLIGQDYKPEGDDERG